MHLLTASIRFESEQAWENFGQGNDEKAVEAMFSDKGVSVQKPISISHRTPPVIEATLEADDDMEAEDIQLSEYPEGLLVHVEDD
ncbi:hypothetical protein BDV59DRAFT_197261 [Aspergillus ambiguus]|uniref:uncharacterized protein n=1 Tax=Aspergillus ambiguus TaxID=176160 RepID=UPI003CCDC036